MNKEDVLQIVEDIEDKKIEVDSKWFYYAHEFDENEYKNILSKGIKADYKKKDIFYHNEGKYYINVSRNYSEYSFCDSAYLQNINYSPLIIIDKNIKVHKANETNLLNLILTNTKIPYRSSFYKDEFQVYKQIDRSSIIGIEFLVKSIIERRIESKRVIYEKSMTDILMDLKNIVLLLEELNINLPIYDYTENREINKDKVLRLKI